MHCTGLHQIQIPIYPLKPSDASRRHQTNLKYVPSQFYNSPDNCYPSHGPCLKGLQQANRFKFDSNDNSNSNGQWYVMGNDSGIQQNDSKWIQPHLGAGTTTTDNNGKQIQPRLRQRWAVFSDCRHKQQWGVTSASLRAAMSMIDDDSKWIQPCLRAIQVQQTTTEPVLWLAKSDLFVLNYSHKVTNGWWVQNNYITYIPISNNRIWNNK